MTIPRRLSWAQCVCAASLLLSLAATPAHAYDWLQFGGDPAHSGRNTLESTITKANVGTLVQKYSVGIGATADGAPVFLEAVSTVGGNKDLLFVTTMDGRIIALDATTGAIVWSHQYGPGTCKINNGGSACYTTSSPAIDPNRLFVYSYGLDGFVHKYQVGNGTEILTGGWPQLTTLKGFDEKGSGAISFATSGGITYLYVVHGGYPGDAGDYQGHVTAINLATGTQKVFNAACSDKPVHLQHYSGSVTPTTCASHQDAIWSRPGVIYDAGTDRIFMGTGNGTFSGNAGGFTWSESVFAIHPDGSGGTGVNAGKPVDSYTPSNYQALDNADADLGSTAPAILPVTAQSTVQHLAAQGGKDSQIRLINLANMSGLGGPGHVMGDPGAIQVGTVLNLPQGGVVLSQPAVWANPADNSTWVFVVNNSGTAAYKVVYDGANNPSMSLQWNNGTGGTSPVIANNILFNVGGNTVRARDPANGAALWSTSPLGGTHWHSLIVANGAVYTTDGSAHLFRFALPTGLNPTSTAVTTSLTPSTFGTSVTFTATISGGVSPTGTIGFADGGTTLSGCGTVAVVAAKATCTISTLAVGTHSIVATYSGDATNAGSISPALTQVVNPVGGTSTNVALASNGGVASASSSLASGYLPAAVNNGDRAGLNWGAGGGWNDGTLGVFPDWVQINFNGPQTIDHVVVYSVQDNWQTPVDPPANLTFSQYGVTDFQVQSWNGSAWVTLGSVVGNNLVKRTVNFPATTTDRIRVNITNALYSYSRVVEVEAWTVGGGGQSNVALAANGGVASASSILASGYLPAAVNNGDRAGLNWGGGGGWNDGTLGVFPDWVQINFNGSKTIDHVVVYSVQDNWQTPVDPPANLTFSLYGVTDFQVQSWNGSAWVTLGSVVGNNLVKRTVNFAAVTTDRIRINITNALYSYSRVVEVEAWGN